MGSADHLPVAPPWALPSRPLPVRRGDFWPDAKSVLAVLAFLFRRLLGGRGGVAFVGLAVKAAMLALMFCAAFKGGTFCPICLITQASSTRMQVFNSSIKLVAINSQKTVTQVTYTSSY